MTGSGVRDHGIGLHEICQHAPCPVDDKYRHAAPRNGYHFSPAVACRYPQQPVRLQPALFLMAQTNLSARHPDLHDGNKAAWRQQRDAAGGLPNRLKLHGDLAAL
ncbi:hypothetical protein PTKU46_80860 [Paraburkholderia terrae]